MTDRPDTVALSPVVRIALPCARTLQKMLRRGYPDFTVEELAAWDEFADRIGEAIARAEIEAGCTCLAAEIEGGARRGGLTLSAVNPSCPVHARKDL